MRRSSPPLNSLLRAFSNSCCGGPKLDGCGVECPDSEPDGGYANVDGPGSESCGGYGLLDGPSSVFGLADYQSPELDRGLSKPTFKPLGLEGGLDSSDEYPPGGVFGNSNADVGHHSGLACALVVGDIVIVASESDESSFSVPTTSESDDGS